MAFVDTSLESGRDISRSVNIHFFNSLGFASTGGGGLFRWGIESGKFCTSPSFLPSHHFTIGCNIAIELLVYCV